MFQKIGLPYSLNALEPYYNEETLKLHYDVLYAGYIDNANKVEGELQTARDTNDFSNIKCLEKNLSFFGSGAILHELFFLNLKPESMQSNPSTELIEYINRDFGSFEKFKNQFSAAAENVEASRMVLTCMGSINSKIASTAM